jgi:hypothetical protein
VIRIRLVAGDVDELHAAAAAVGQALAVTRTSRPVPRRSGDGVSLYLDAVLPAAGGGVAAALPGVATALPAASSAVEKQEPPADRRRSAGSNAATG